MKRTAVVTGGSKGLGRVIADFLANSGYDVIVTARNIEDSPQGSGRVIAIAGDVTDAEHRREIARVVSDLGGLDVLVNNASDLGPSPMPALTDYPLDALRHVLDVNVAAPVALVQELLPSLRERRGLIVNITSDAAVGAYENWGGYGASKAALELIGRTLAAELASDGVASVVVDPGDMRTDMHQAAFPGEDITDRPLPDVTVPFWAWLFAANHAAINGGRFRAQGESWELDGAERLRLVGS